MQSQSNINEQAIAIAAGHVLHECFIETARNEKVLYVENDIIWSKAPNEERVLIKKLSGRNPDLAKRFASRGTFKLKKRNLDFKRK